MASAPPRRASVAYTVVYNDAMCVHLEIITSCEMGNKVVDPNARIACGVVNLRSAEREKNGF